MAERRTIFLMPSRVQKKIISTSAMPCRENKHDPYCTICFSCFKISILDSVCRPTALDVPATNGVCARTTINCVGERNIYLSLASPSQQQCIGSVILNCNCRVTVYIMLSSITPLPLVWVLLPLPSMSCLPVHVCV